MRAKRYDRNRIYLSEKEQKKIRTFRVLLGGAGIGSNIAETLLRLGFEHLTIVDGDVVEESNLNRQNYVNEDIGKNKANTLKDRLLHINPEAKIKSIPHFITPNNVEEIINGHDVAVNALDFKSDIPFLFDEVCARLNVTVLHPFNVGFAGVVMVVRPDSLPFNIILKEYANTTLSPELKAIRHVVDYFNYLVKSKLWLETILNEYEKENGAHQPPQLSIASNYVAGMTSSIIYQLAIGGYVKALPRFYYYSVVDDLN